MGEKRMILLIDGYGIQREDWHVDEPVAAGYSRVYLVESGHIHYRENGVLQTLEPEKMYIFPASTPYSMIATPGESFVCLYFHIDFFPIGFPCVIPIDPKKDETLKHFWSLLQTLYLQNQAQSGYGRKIVEAFGDYVQQTYLPQYQAPMGEAAAYIRAHFRDRELNVNSISTHFGCTPEHFIRTFARAMGLTPYQYLLNMRMYEARRLLLENHSVQDTALAVGYENPRVFSHAFQKKYGVPPGEFRRSFAPLV